MEAVGKMTAFWNVPIIGYMASSNTFANKNIYKTMSRVSLCTTNSLALAVASIIRHYKWKKVFFSMLLLNLIKDSNCD